MTETQNVPAAIRCSDADRERTSARLRDAAAEGRLSMDELEDRLGETYAARYHHELEVLVADLPPAAASAVAPTGWRAILAALWVQLRSEFLLLLGRRGRGWTGRRVVLAVIAGIFLAGVMLSALYGFGGEHHGFEQHGLHGGGFERDGF